MIASFPDNSNRTLDEYENPHTFSTGAAAVEIVGVEITGELVGGTGWAAGVTRPVGDKVLAGLMAAVYKKVCTPPDGSAREGSTVTCTGGSGGECSAGTSAVSTGAAWVGAAGATWLPSGAVMMTRIVSGSGRTIAGRPGALAWLGCIGPVGASWLDGAAVTSGPPETWFTSPESSGVVTVPAWAGGIVFSSFSSTTKTHV
jgi:hypothetical protein